MTSPAGLNLKAIAMTDRKIEDKWLGKEGSDDGKDGGRRRRTRGLLLQRNVDPDVEEVYSGVGTSLRAERQKRRLTLVDIASALRIQQAHLLALEEGRADDLPGPTYVIGFLRTYSEYFDLDSDEIIRQFKREATLVPVERRLVFPEPLNEARRPGLTTALISLLVAGAVYGGWIFMERQGFLPIDVVAEPPERLAPYQAAFGAGDTTARDAAGNIAGVKADNSVAAATPKAEPVVPRTDAGVQKPTTNALETKIIDAPTATPAATSGEVAAATIGAAPIQPAQPADHLDDAGTTSRTVMMAKPGEGVRAAASDVNAMANTPDTLAPTLKTKTSVSIGDIPVSAKLATTADTTVSPDYMDSANKLAIEDQTALVATTVEAAGAQPTPLSPEVRYVDAAPSIQVAIAPPPPPVAPEASVRSVGEGASGGASADDTGPASLATAADGLGYRPQSYGAATSDVRVVLRARAESWVQVQGANNELLLTRMLRTGDSYYAPNRTDLVLMTGNAGAIEIIVDGVELGPLGPIGLVRRNILLDADHLRLQLMPPGRSSR